jgi:hypothetical protein
MHLRGFPNDSWSGGVRELGGLAKEWVQKVCGVELTEPVYAKVSVDAVGVETELVGVDSGGED